MAVGQNPVPLDIKIGGKWMLHPKMSHGHIYGYFAGATEPQLRSSECSQPSLRADLPTPATRLGAPALDGALRNLIKAP